MDLASVDQVLRTTRSVRRRIDFERRVPPELLEECIEIATQAPTGINAENWRFLVLTDAAPKAAIADLYRRALGRLERTAAVTTKPAQQALAERLHEMPALILVCAEGRPPTESVPLQVGFYGSILPAAWSLMLALRSRGLGSTWTSLHLLYADETAQRLGIPDGVTQTVLLPVGYTKNAVLNPATRKPPGEVTYWNAWGNTRQNDADPRD
jgi:nitroreductase